jgi:hypothetical protein
MCDIDGCKLVSYKNNKCILHSDDKSKDIKFFWDEIKNIIDKTNKSYKKDKKLVKEITAEYNYEIFKYEFENIIFPESILEEREYKSFYDLDKDLNINFKNCTFKEKIDFSLLSSAKAVSFSNCIFNEDIEFKYQKFQDLFIFEKCTVNSNIKFQNIVFLGITSFIGTTFNEKIEFIHSRSEDLFLFNSTKIEEIFIDNTFFNSESNFLDMKNKEEKDLKAENIKNRETARIIKHSFENLNNIIEANKFYALEMEKRREELSTDIEKGKNIFEYFIFHFHNLSSNHSTNPLLVLFWILIFSLFYSYCFDFLEKQELYIECFDEKYLKSWIYTFYNFKEIFDLFLVITIIFGIFLLVYLVFNQKNENLGLMIIFAICSISFYIFLTKDFYLFLVAKNFNPFSIMTKGEDLSFSMLIYKSTIAYLIYQFIISIRQNTRRK